MVEAEAAELVVQVALQAQGGRRLVEADTFADALSEEELAEADGVTGCVRLRLAMMENRGTLLGEDLHLCYALVFTKEFELIAVAAGQPRWTTVVPGKFVFARQVCATGAV